MVGKDTYQLISKHEYPKMSFISQLSLAIVLFIVSNNASAMLIDRGGGLIYDDVQDITWLADFNPSKTLGENPGYYWDEAVTFVDNYSYYDSVRNTTWEDWRLPTLNRLDPSCDTVGNFPSPDSTPFSIGYNCALSELSHLFYQDLGGEPDSALHDTGNLTTIALFNNMPDTLLGGDNTYLFWTGVDHYVDSTIYAEEDRDIAFAYNMSLGDQFFFPKNKLKMTAMAVRDGDVGIASIPEPSSLGLMSVALLGLLLADRRQNKVSLK